VRIPDTCATCPPVVAGQEQAGQSLRRKSECVNEMGLLRKTWMVWHFEEARGLWLENALSGGK